MTVKEFLESLPVDRLRQRVEESKERAYSALSEARGAIQEIDVSLYRDVLKQIEEEGETEFSANSVEEVRELFELVGALVIGAELHVWTINRNDDRPSALDRFTPGAN